MTPRPVISTRAWFAAALILVLALLVRVWGLDARSLWFDEASEYWVATAPFSGLGDAVRDGSGDPPLYATLLHFWMGLGKSEAHLRFLSVIFSVAGVAGAIVLGRRLGGKRTAFAAGLLAALSAADIRYAQEVGQYALMVAALTWNLVALERLSRDSGMRSIAAWGLTALIAAYTYFAVVIAVLVPLACVLVSASRARDRARLRALAIALGTFVVGALPLAVAFLPAQLARVVALPGMHSLGGPTNLMQWMGWLQQPLSFPFTGWPYGPVPAWVSAPLLGVLLILGVIANRRVAVWLGATWLAYLIADRSGVFPYGFRWGLIVAPFLTALIALGATTRLPFRVQRIAVGAAFAMVLGMMLMSLPTRAVRDAYFPEKRWAWPETEDMRPIVDYWRESRVDGQPTYVYYGAAPAFAYYAERSGATTTDRAPTWHLECWHRGREGYCSRDGVYYGRWLRSLGDDQRISNVFATFRTEPREFWMIFAHMQPEDDIRLVTGLTMRGYQVVSVSQGRDAAAFLMRRM